jgi:coproporphyrinogen III oxidase-like Fe-S oxidoreductase
MDLWSQLGSLPTRPLSTIHFGGGTPTFLGAKPFERLVRACRERFADGSTTEWALESTASELSPEMLAGLNALGFTRLHVGVQSLQDEIRKLINRRAAAATVLETIARAIAMGWIVSVDLIYGLPSQTLDGLLGDIRALIAVGVDGFSLYELQISSRNRRFAKDYGLDARDRRFNFLMAQCAAQLLVARGFERTLFNHFAGEQDTNLYFTYPMRGEDCLALGTVADGVFDDYHYRHPKYAAYRRGVDGRFPGLEGGLRRNEVENRMQPLITGLMAGRIPPSLFDDPERRALRDRWQGSLLLEKAPQSDELRLTGSGAWFVGNMISELASHAVGDQPGAS